MEHWKWLTRRKSRLSVVLALFTVLALMVTSCAGDQADSMPAETESSDTEVMMSDGTYKEAPSLADQVSSGDLPPVEERLPATPAVAVPIDSVGIYNDTMFVFVPSNEPWNTMQEETERGSYLGYIKADNSVVGNLAESFELSPDFMSLTIHLREGAKWSDGHPFTADDIMFVYEDVHFHPALGGGQPYWMNKVRRAVKVDDYTVRLETDEPYPVMLAKMGEPAGGDWHGYLPKHYLSQFHLDYNPKAEELAEELGYATWTDMFNAHDWEFENGYQHIIERNEIRPTMQPWMLVEVSDTSKVHVRNPYFWKVDEAGQQLPYIDRIVTGISDPETINLKIIAGEVDLDYGSVSVDNFALYKENEAAGGYTTRELQLQGDARVGFAVNQTIDDPVKRPVFQDLRFRQALSLAINADEINETVYFGLGRPMAFPVVGTSFDLPKWESNPADAYNVDEANALLDAVGLDQKDSNGWRLGSDGEPFTLTMEGRGIGEASTQFASLELIKEYWESVGLQTEIKISERALYIERRDGNLIEINTGPFTLGSEARQYMIDREFWAHGSHDLNWAPLWGDWLLADVQIAEGTATVDGFDGGVMPGEEPPEIYKELFQWNEARSKTVLGSPEYTEVSQKIFDFHFDNLLMQGVVGGLPQLVIAKENLQNVPKGYFGSAIWFGDLHIESAQLYFK
ncbi:MAG: ABC transporter substrate-binding protein [Chloroflexota bacterium]